MFTINKSVSVWEQLVQLPFLNLYSRLLNAAMELDVFSYQGYGHFLLGMFPGIDHILPVRQVRFGTGKIQAFAG